MAAKTYTMNTRTVVASIRSQSDPTRRYNVMFATCGALGVEPCGDFLHRHTRGNNPFCKHIISGYLQEMGMSEAAATELAPTVMGLLDLVAQAAEGDIAARLDKVAAILALTS